MSDKSKRTASHVRSMLKYCQDVLDLQTNFGGRSFTSFMTHKGYQYSVSFCIEQIGELAKKLRDEGFAEKYPNIQWNEIAGMRNRIAHGYDTIDLDMVYSIATEDIPKLLVDCQHMLLNETQDINEKMALSESLKTKVPGTAGTVKEKERENG